MRRCKFKIQELIPDLNLIIEEPFKSIIHNKVRDLCYGCDVGYSIVYGEYYFIYKSSEVEMHSHELKFHTFKHFVDGINGFFSKSVGLDVVLDYSVLEELMKCSESGTKSSCKIK